MKRRRPVKRPTAYVRTPGQNPDASAKTPAAPAMKLAACATARDSPRERRSPGPGFAPPTPGNKGGFHFGCDPPDDGTPAVRSEQSLSLDGVRSVQVDQTAGKLTIRNCKEGETPGIVSIGNKSTPEVSVQRAGERLMIEVKLTKGWIFRRRQGATTVIRLDPCDFEHVKIEKATAKPKSGLSARTPRECRRGLHTGSSPWEHRRERRRRQSSVLSQSALRAVSGHGDVLLDVAELVPGEYKVDVGLGRAEVRLPAGGEVYIRAQSGIGKSRIEYPSAAEGAPIRLRLNSGIGECIVKAREPGASTVEQAASMASQMRPQRPSRAAAQLARAKENDARIQMLRTGKITQQDAAP